MVTTEGLKVSPSIEALAPDEGFIVRIHISWAHENSSLKRMARDEDLLGQIHNGHEATFADALTKISSVVSTWTTDIQTFIDNWNAEH